MKKIILSILLLSSLFNFSFAQVSASEQQRRADAYYQNQDKKTSNSGGLFWDLLFGNKSSYNRSNILKVEYSNGWIAGEGRGETLDGLGAIRLDDYMVAGTFEKSKLKGIGFGYWGADEERNIMLYAGGWLNGKWEGYGITIWGDGALNYGYWENDERNGFFINEYPNGGDNEPFLRKYVGMYKENERTGYGIKYLSNGKILAGVWKENILVTEIDRFIVLEKLGF